MNELTGILKDQVRLLADWNKQALNTYGNEEQVRKNCETISLLINHLTQLGC